MEQEEPPKKLEGGKSTRSFWSGKGEFLLILFLYAVVEWVFILRILTLIGSQVPYYYYLLNAIAFEACLVASAFALWRCLRVLESAEEVILNRKNLAWQITVLVMMLLLALMQFSSFSRFYDKIKF
jgi:hypothetical protein